MQSWRKVKANARGTVHKTFSEPCWVIRKGVALPAMVRIHDKKLVQTGDLSGEPGFAVTDERVTKALFAKKAFLPLRHDYIVTEDRFYGVENILPCDDFLAYAEVTPLNDTEIRGAGLDKTLPFGGKETPVV